MLNPAGHVTNSHFSTFLLSKSDKTGADWQLELKSLKSVIILLSLISVDLISDSVLHEAQRVIASVDDFPVHRQFQLLSIRFDQFFPISNIVGYGFLLSLALMIS